MCASPSDPKKPRGPFDVPVFLTDELGDLFEAHRPYGRSETGFLTGRSFHPAADVYETAEALMIVLEVPGMERDQIDIRLEGGRLVVAGSRGFVKSRADEEFVRLERGFGSFARAFEVPQDADTDAITAKLDLGVLTITIPRRNQSLTIQVEQADGK
jgi:HSP20 family protein